jgi:Resolvase, N terminal domain
MTTPAITVPHQRSQIMKRKVSQQPATPGHGGDVRVGVYVRRSTDDEHQPYSIEAQDARLTAYIGSQLGWHQAARFADDASGASTHRPGLQRALAAARRRTCGAAIHHAHQGRQSHRPGHRLRHAQPAQSAHRSAGRTGQDHRPRPHRSRVPHPAAQGHSAFRDQQQGVRCSCNDQFGGAPGARTQNPRIKSPLLYH